MSESVDYDRGHADGIRACVTALHAYATELRLHGYHEAAVQTSRSAVSLARHFEPIDTLRPIGCGWPLTSTARCGEVTDDRKMALCDSCEQQVTPRCLLARLSPRVTP